MIVLVLLLVLAACPAWAGDPVISSPLAFQINASAGTGPDANLSLLVDPDNTEGVPIGQWIEFDFSKNVAVTRMTVANGWVDPAAFHQHSRIKTAQLVFENGSTQTVSLKDTNKPQVINLKGEGSKVKLTVSAVYPGRSSQAPYLSRVAFEGYDPSLKQVTVTGRYEGCVHSRSSSNWGGGQEPLYYCVRFHTDDGKDYGCMDDLCFHTKDLVNVHLRVTGVIKPGDVLEVLEAKPVK